MSGKYSGGGSGDKPIVNSLLNAFVPEDLVTFSPIPAPTVPLYNFSLPPQQDVALADAVTSEIDLGAEDETENHLKSMSTPNSMDKEPIFVQDYPPESNFVYGIPATSTLEPTFTPESISSDVVQNFFEAPTPLLASNAEPLEGVTGVNDNDLLPVLPESTSNVVQQVTPLESDAIEKASQNTSTSLFADSSAEVSSTSVLSSDYSIPLRTEEPYSSTLPNVTSEGSSFFAPALTMPTEVPPSTIAGIGVWPLGQLGASQGPPPPTNTFRMGSQKKLVYAKYPGLSSDAAPAAYNYQQPPPPPMPAYPESNISTNLILPPPSAPPSTTPSEIMQPLSYPPAEPYTSNSLYRPVLHHWFFRKDGELWKPFSHVDSRNLEDAFTRGSGDLVSVDGGRQDVDLEKRTRQPVYWEDTDVTHVQRCSWFYKGPMDSQFMPYTEAFSSKLEEEYETACRTNIWQKRLEFTGGEAVVLQGPHSFVHFCQQASADEWGSVPESQLRPRVVKRGAEGLQIPPAEPTEIDYLVFLVHGIGSFCDFKFRTVVETVDDFRHISNQLLQTHFKDVTGRVEFLPIQWHKALHGDGGIDEKLKPLTLKSIPKLRHFTNDTLLDILFYTSPVYCQTIMNTVGNEMNRMYTLFLERNPTFNCLSVAVAGHSLGSLILFDLLAHQPEMSYPNDDKLDGMSSPSETVPAAGGAENHRLVSYRVGSAGTGQPSISYPVLDFQPTAFFAMGSPIAMFVAVRGLDSLGLDFHFPTCPAFFNIFHPYDPVAYRLESLIDPTLDLRPVLIPHHKGRKRFHLELKETMARVGTDLKNRVMESLRVTYKAVTELAGMTKVEQEVDNAIASELNGAPGEVQDERSEGEERKQRVGSLNGGRRIDHVLQEAPHQILNEYLFALSSHVCYWESEDTVLLILNEILNEGRSTPSTPEPSSPVPQDDVSQTFDFPSQITYNQRNNVGNNTVTADTVIPAPLITSSVMNAPIMSNSLATGLVMSAHVPPPPLPGTTYTTGKRPLTDPQSIQRQPLGMDPTAPISAPSTALPPPPKFGFRPKS